MTPKIQLGTSNVESQKVDIVVLAVPQGSVASSQELRRLDAALGGGISGLISAAEFVGKLDQCLEFTPLGKLRAAKVILMGAGDGTMEPGRLRVVAANAARYAQNAGARRVALHVPGVDSDEKWRALAEGITLGAYRFTKYFTSEKRARPSIDTVVLCSDSKGRSTVKRQLALGVGVGQAVATCRDAVNEPSNVLTPKSFAERANAVARRHSLKIKILDRRGIDRTGMALLAAVGRGSANEPRFIHITYSPKGRSKRRLVFLGKGLTFDSGGLCIKPAAGMEEMKTDMAGAAAVLGLMDALGVVRPNVEVHGLFVLAENMPDGNAYRPGDVITSLDGKTVEIINTDAEGRLALADGLTYARRLQPDLIVDAATLTGACMVALGKHCSAYFATHDEWAESWRRAADQAGEQFWRMPLLTDLRDQLKSDIADLKHTGDRWGGAITAAMFLREFVGDAPWIHCDIAGPVVTDRAKGFYTKGATGHPVMTFLKFIEALA